VSWQEPMRNTHIRHIKWKISDEKAEIRNLDSTGMRLSGGKKLIEKLIELKILQESGNNGRHDFEQVKVWKRVMRY